MPSCTAGKVRHEIAAKCDAKCDTLPVPSCAHRKRILPAGISLAGFFFCALKSAMPRRSSFPCKHRGCAELVRKPGYCEKHAGEAVNWKAVHEKGTRRERGYGPAWDRLRASILQRDQHLCRCAECALSGRVRAATQVDHRIPKFEGGTDDPANLYAINAECHRRKTGQEGARARRARR